MKDAIKKLLYADDLLLANGKQELQESLEQWNRLFTRHGLKINLEKMEVLHIGHQREELDIELEGKQLTQGDSFVNLGGAVCGDGKTEREVRRRAQAEANAWRAVDGVMVLPVPYNMGTWGLTKTELSRLDAHHRRHLRQIIGIRWPHRISNDALYRRTHSSPISATIRAARWSLFGHVLRLPLYAPVQRAIDAYLEDTGTPKFRGRPRCTLPTTLGENLRRIGRQLRDSDDIDALRTLDRSTWRDLGRELA